MLSGAMTKERSTIATEPHACAAHRVDAPCLHVTKYSLFEEFLAPSG